MPIPTPTMEAQKNVIRVAFPVIVVITVETTPMTEVTASVILTVEASAKSVGIASFPLSSRFYFIVTSATYALPL